MSNTYYKFEKKVYKRNCWCDWCCNKFSSTEPLRRFCGKDCTWAWMEAKQRRAKEPSKDSNVG